MYSQKQQGNGLLSFMLGSVALLIMLVVLVLTLDNGDHNFKASPRRENGGKACYGNFNADGGIK